MRYTIFLCLLFLQLNVNASSKANYQRTVDAPVNILFILADDMSLQAGVYGDKVISTPGIDNIARDGILFEKAFVTASSCSPSRASILTGKYPHQLKEGGNLWGTLPKAYPNYADLLEKNGYKIGVKDKGWGPGDYTVGGYKENPAGPQFESFEQFMNQLPENKPFCFWIGSHYPHRPYASDLKKTMQLNEKELKVPSWLPDNKKVREDLLDYYAEVKRFDQTVQEAINVLRDH